MFYEEFNKRFTLSDSLHWFIEWLLATVFEKYLCSFNCLFQNKRTPLHLAAESGRLECIAKLLALDADPNSNDAVSDLVNGLQSWQFHRSELNMHVIASNITSRTMLCTFFEILSCTGLSKLVRIILFLDLKSLPVWVTWSYQRTFLSWSHHSASLLAYIWQQQKFSTKLICSHGFLFLRLHNPEPALVTSYQK